MKTERFDAFSTTKSIIDNIIDAVEDDDESQEYVLEFETTSVSSSCSDCKRPFTCPCKQINVEVEHEDIKNDPIPQLITRGFKDIQGATLVDLFFSSGYDNKHLIAVTETESFKIQMDQITVLADAQKRDLKIINQQSNDDLTTQEVSIPVVKSNDTIRLPLKSVVSKESAHNHYMMLSSEFSDLALSKIIHDNDITLRAAEKTTIVYYDIETYSSDISFNDVPHFKFSHCHISTIQLLIDINGKTSKVILVNDQGSYVYDHSKLEDVKVIMLENDERCARAFFNILKGLGQVIAIAYNASVDVYGNSTRYQWQGVGYDLPWLIQRSHQSWIPHVSAFKCKYLAGSGRSMNMSQQITVIEQLPMVKFVDAMKAVCDDLETDKKKNVSSLSLHTVAEAYELAVNKSSISFSE